MYYSSDKIYIYISPEYISRIDNDARDFEVFNEDGRSINRNGFLSMLICGYYVKYLEEERISKTNIIDALENVGISDLKKDELADSIMHSLATSKTKSPKVKKHRLMLRINKMNRYYVEAITNNCDDSDSISQNFCRLIVSYFEKPIYERERIIFNNYYRELIEACNSKRAVMIKTKNKRSEHHKVIPYKVCLGKDERFNYLLCAEIDSDTGKQYATSYRLNRLRGSVIPISSVSSIESDVERHLHLMEKYGAQYRINEDVEACVKLTEQGVQKFIKIYWGRPIETKVEKKGDDYYFYFNCSMNQLELYFNRFGGDAEIISPFELRNAIVQFHSESLKPYGY